MLSTAFAFLLGSLSALGAVVLLLGIGHGVGTRLATAAPRRRTATVRPTPVARPDAFAARTKRKKEEDERSDSNFDVREARKASDQAVTAGLRGLGFRTVEIASVLPRIPYTADTAERVRAALLALAPAQVSA